MSDTYIYNNEDKIINTLSGRASEGELAELRDWLAASDSNRRLYNEYASIWLSSSAVGRNNDYLPDAAWARVSKKLKTPHRSERKIPWRKILIAATVLIFVFMAGIMTDNFPGKRQVVDSPLTYTEYTSPYGSKSKVKLSDGSSVWLNAGSILRYSSDFNKVSREVYIEGEGYFDVARNEQIPFFVQTTTIAIKVLGTAFNVKAYPEEAIVETTVERGSVQLLDPSSASQKVQTILQANQKAVVVKSVQPEIQAEEKTKPINRPSEIKPISYIPISEMEVSNNVKVEAYTSWKDHRWIIESEKLVDLAVKLERRYNIRIVFVDVELKDYVFSGKFEDETLDQVLEVMKMTAPIHYKVKHNMVYLNRNRIFRMNQ